MIARKLIGRVITFKQGADGGRDASFSGRAVDWPNENGLTGKFVLQAKHTRSETADCSASDFRTLVQAEYSKITRLVRDGDCDYYLLFTAWKLPAEIDRELIREIEELGVKKADIIAAETLKRIIGEHPEIDNWVYQKTEASRAKSMQRWERLIGIRREQDARTRNVVGFMNEAFIAAKRKSEDLISPNFENSTDLAQTLERPVGLASFCDRLGISEVPVLVEAPIGAGKSVSAKMLVQRRLSIIDDDVSKYDQHKFWLPLYITGSEIQNNWETLVDLVDRATAKTDHRNWRLIVDGVDEIKSAEIRARVIDFAISKHQSKSSSLGFVFFARPDTIETENFRSLVRYRISSFDRGQRLQAVRLFTASEAEANEVLASLEISLGEDIISRPLFLALAAYLVASGFGEINSKFELIDFFVDDILKRTEAKSGHNERELHTELIELANGGTSKISKSGRRGAAAVNASNERLSALSASGIVEVTATVAEFSHQIFHHYFKAKKLAEQVSPTPKVWGEVDPFDLGWETVSLLCECWDVDGKNLNASLTALARLSGEGFERAVNLAAICRNVDDEVRHEIALQFLREYGDGGVAPVTENTLSKIAKVSELTREHLIHVARAGSGEFFDSRVLAARCVASFDSAKSQKLLNDIAVDEWVCWDDRLAAANELIELDCRELAINAYRKLSFEGDEFQGRFDAAVSALEITNEQTDRLRLAEVISEYKNDDNIYGDTLGKAALLGFEEFAVPLIRAPIENALSNGISRRSPYRHDLDSALWRCETLSSIGFTSDALSYYERLLALDDLSSRNVADILASIQKAGFDDVVCAKLKDSKLLERLRVEPDWFTAELLAMYGYENTSVEDMMSSFQRSISDPSSTHSALSSAERLISNGRSVEVARIIEDVPANKRSPRHFEILALCGKRLTAKEGLLKGVRTWETRTQIHASEVLDGIGFRDIARDKLLGMCRDVNLSVEDRTDAALASVELGNNDMGEVENCLKAAQNDERLLARVANKLLNSCDAANELAWAYLSSKLSRSNVPQWVRYEYASVLREYSVPEGFEEQYEDLVDEIYGLLENVSDPWLFSQCVRSFCGYQDPWERNEIVIRRLSAEPALWSTDVVISVCRIEEIRHAVRQQLVDFCLSDDCDLQTEISALKKLVDQDQDEEAHSRLSRIAHDNNVPGKWRIAAAGVSWKTSRSDKSEFNWSAISSDYEQKDASQIDLLYALGTDSNLTVECRFSTLNELKDDAQIEQLIHLIEGISDCSDSTRIDIAKRLAELSAISEANALLDDLLSRAPHSLWEIEQLLELCDTLGRQDVERTLCEIVVGLSDIVVEWIEDTSSLNDLAIRIEKVLGKASALRLLKVAAERNQWAMWEEQSISAAFAAIDASDQLPGFSAKQPRNFVDSDGSVDWGALYEVRDRLDQGNFQDLPALKRLIFSPNTPFGARTQAVEILHRFPDTEVSDKALDEALRGQQTAAHTKEVSPSEALAFAQCLVASRKQSMTQQVIDLIKDLELKSSEQIAFSKLLSSASMPNLAFLQLSKLNNLCGYFGQDDLGFLEEQLGRSELQLRISTTLADERNDIFDRIELAGEAVSRFGSKTALNFMAIAPQRSDVTSSELNRLAEQHYELGSRKTSIDLLDRALDAPKPDYYWLADFCIFHLGRKKLAEKLLKDNLASFEKGYVTQVMRRLADLHLDKELVYLANKTFHGR